MWSLPVSCSTNPFMHTLLLSNHFYSFPVSTQYSFPFCHLYSITSNTIKSFYFVLPLYRQRYTISSSVLYVLHLSSVFIICLHFSIYIFLWFCKVLYYYFHTYNVKFYITTSVVGYILISSHILNSCNTVLLLH